MTLSLGRGVPVTLVWRGHPSKLTERRPRDPPNSTGTDERIMFHATFEGGWGRLFGVTRKSPRAVAGARAKSAAQSCGLQISA